MKVDADLDIKILTRFFKAVIDAYLEVHLPITDPRLVERLIRRALDNAICESFAKIATKN